VRVRIIFKLKNKGSFLPFHHQFILAQFIKGVMVKGGNEKYVNYPFYNFSGLKGQTKVSRSGLHYYSNLVTLVLSAQDKDFVDYVLKLIFEFDTIPLGNLEISPLSTELEVQPKLTEDNKFICISPTVPVKSTFNGVEGKRFILPESDEFSDLLYDSTMQRMEASGLYSPEQFESFNKFQVVPDMDYLNKLRAKEKKFARIYSVFDMDVKYEARGYTLPFKLYAAKEVQEFVFNCGLGQYTYKGFGMLDLANIDPVGRSKEYIFKKAGASRPKSKPRPRVSPAS
jgi:CRISPR-associated endoribonuclease Cas6